MTQQIEIKMVHLQITSRCNLRCPYCGQWGDKGFMKKHHFNELSLEKWLKVVNYLEEIKDVFFPSENLPHICIWGGEPLLSEFITELVKYLFEKKFKIGIVSNGTLLKEYIPLIQQYVHTLYISLDGPEDIHDTSRGARGIFKRITQNIKELKEKKFEGTLVCLCTINHHNYSILPEIPFFLSELGFDRVIFQPLMFFRKEEIDMYKKWLRDTFNIFPLHAEAWLDEKLTAPDSYIYKLPKYIQKLNEGIESNTYPIETILSPKVLNQTNIITWYTEGTSGFSSNISHCLAPWQHLHITSTGNVCFCVDFDDFYVGNISENSLYELITNNKANKFREEIKKGNNPFCKRCLWRFNTKYLLDEKGKM